MSKKKKTTNRKTPPTPKGKPSAWWALPVSLFMLLALFASAYLIANEVNEYDRFRIMRAAVENQNYYSGVTIDDIPVSGYSLDRILEHWNENVETPYRSRTVTLSNGEQSWTIDAESLGYTSDYESVLKEAWSLGRSGSLEERYRSVNHISTDKVHYNVTRTLYDSEKLRAWTDEIAGSLTVAPVNAAVENFDTSTHSFTFNASASGTFVDPDSLYEQASAALNRGIQTVSIDVQSVLPEFSLEDCADRFGMITQAVTSASSSTKNRLTNLTLACAAINGYCVMPGETFSFNDVVGQRTSSKGYKKATVYQSGDIAEDYGGGVCQVSTTLWNAAMKANCEIVERHEHSRPVSYVDKGKDATVSWTSQDMKFKNTSEYPMYLICYMDNKRVYCEVYGMLFPDGKYITIEAKTTKTMKPDEPKYIPNPLLMPGATRVVSEARTGYKASAYRVYHNADGTEINRVELCTSNYKSARAEIEYGPEV